MLLKPDIFSSILSTTTSTQWTCIACLRRSHLQLRQASTTASQAKAPPPPLEYAPKIFEDSINDPEPSQRIAPGPPKPDPKAKLSRAQIEDLSRPPLPYLAHLVGADHPPRPGQNPAKDRRPFGERMNSYWTREAHDERRRKIDADLQRFYFRDLTSVRKYQGKTWVAPEAPFQASVSKYFPNFQGYTHADQWNYVDTTKLLLGKISVVCFARTQWAAAQVASFVDEKHNPELMRLIDEDWGGVGLQRVWVTFEDAFMHKIIMYLFYAYARKQAGKEAARSLVVTRGVDREFFETQMGIANLRVGNVFLVDALCRIRWVGNGDAYDEEKASLVRVMKRLVQERKSALERMKEPLVKKPVERKSHSPRPLSAMMTK